MQPFDDFSESHTSHRHWWDLDFSDYLEELESAADSFSFPPIYLARYFEEVPGQDL